MPCIDVGTSSSYDTMVGERGISLTGQMQGQ